MFDIGFTELMVVAVVALVVLGPERLPKAARFAGLWVRRARAQWASVKSELERELAADELKRNLKDAKQAVRDTEQAMREGEADARREFEQVRESLKGVAATATANVTETQSESTDTNADTAPTDAGDAVMTPLPATAADIPAEAEAEPEADPEDAVASDDAQPDLFGPPPADTGKGRPA
ncbi:twin-arginine translocase subunit TatB [Pseudoxanthomonas kalamensis DSM 18571]|uniref:Sec-independent protein translocase protein TatB n=1 Tax=Pseudoxanthomonas kalamensis TaxID=289483 RepID=UPI001391CB2A|nr:Sec-independent protein translocase protein TatB [Pseudoxanthomonas kalamensis]KAF1712407.1 twin-arginine translocase subunit TatB [Pseudoxanthomonas kalamensis DSM 18571]